ncbi:MAG: DUF1385 domain-containing protein [Clostridiales bacterium]|nr:DUF1385 domain-containing protein [Clostridiales bacterium]
MAEKEYVKSKGIGGQAVIEGVMMRGKGMYALAVRTPDHQVVVEKTKITGIGLRKGIFRYPVFRGMAAFVDSLIIGTKTLMRSAELAGEGLEEEGEPSKFEKWITKLFGDKTMDVLIYFSVGLSLVMAIALFFLLPVVIGSFFKNILPGTWALSIVEGLVRIAIFIGYLVLISHMKDIQRVYQYHGAEHKTINCFEHNEELTVENVKKYTRLHKRCGTSFLLIVMIISMVVFFFIRTDTILLRLISRIVLVPVVAGLSFEVIRWAGSSQSSLVNFVSYPGLCLQKITTAEPDDSQIETAIAALKGVLEDEPE